MKYVVTGSSGFIGTALAASLRARGDEVHGLDIDPGRRGSAHANDHAVDLTSARAVEERLASIRPDTIVHLAARTDLSSDSVIRYGANIEGVLNLLHGAARLGCVRRILWASTQLVSRVGRIPAHDTDFDPDTSYGESKVIGERIVRGLDGGGIPWAILRPTTVWGPGMSEHYAGFLHYIERGRYFHAGPARVLKSYSYIRNAVYQIEQLLAAPERAIHRQTFYIADDTPIDLRAWCDALASELGVRRPVVMPLPVARTLARTGDALNATVLPGFKFNSFRLRNIMTSYVFDTSNLQALAGKLPCAQADGIRETVAWYRSVRKSAAQA